MASKKKYRFTYRLKLFLPSVLLIWITLGLMAWYSFEREKEYRAKNVESDIALINNRIIDMIQQNFPVERFMKFIDNYYSKGDLEGIRVSIFRADSIYPTDWVGEPLLTNFEDMHKKDLDSFYRVLEAQDPVSGVRIRTALPYNVSLDSWLEFDSGFWIFVIIMGLSVTILTYINASHTAKNITLLRDLIDRATTDQDFDPTEKFTNDELGDISRRIVEIYNSRNAAQRAHDREHIIALRATEERARFRKQLTDNVNHELKTPVGIIRGYIDTIVGNPDMDEASRRHFLEKTQNQVNRLVLMLDDISVLARLDDASGKIPTKKVNLNELLAVLDEEIYESGIGGELTFVYELPPECNVMGSDSLINAAILNLVKNAAAYSKGSEMGLLCTGSNDKFYDFVFYDNGTGVDDEYIPKLFDRFFRVESGRSRKTGGTGLGLSIVKSTFIGMGGSISVRNRDTGGLEFIFTLLKWKENQ